MTMSFMVGLSRATEISSAVFKELIPEATKTFTLIGLQKIELPQYIENSTRLMRICHKLGFTAELGQMINTLLRPANVGNAGDNYAVYILESLLLPFLQSLASKILKYSPTALLFRPFQDLYRKLISQYISKTVASKPSRPTDWTRTATSGCNCHNCRSLNAFLSSPARESFDSRRPADERQHLEDRLRSRIRAGTITTATLRSGSPNGLLVKKTLKEYNESIKVWTQKCAAAKTQVTACGLQALPRLLGEHFNTIMSLRPISPSPPAPARQARGELGGFDAPPPPASGQPSLQQVSFPEALFPFSP
jgi:hypothetical protein